MINLIRKGTSLILIMGILVPFVPAQMPDTVFINVYALNVRSGPGLEFEKIGALFLNTPVLVITEEKNWYEILVGDTLEGWISTRFTSPSTITGLEKDIILYHDGDLQLKIQAIKRMTGEHSGPALKFLQDVVLNHEKYDLGVETDKIVLPQIFRGWGENKVTEAIGALVFVMEQDLGGEIGRSAENMREIKLAAKEAIKLLVRE